MIEDKKFDNKTLLGFILIFIIGAGSQYLLAPSKSEIEAKQKSEKEQKDYKENLQQVSTLNIQDNISSNAMALMDVKVNQSQLSNPTSQKQQDAVLENDVLRIVVASKGGYPKEVQLKTFHTFDNKPLYLVKDGKNMLLNLNLQTQNGSQIQTANQHFSSTLTKNGDQQILKMRHQIDQESYLEYVYALNPKEYMLDFSIDSKGFVNKINTSSPVQMQWGMEMLRQAKSAKYENRYTKLIYEYANGKDSSLGQGKTDEDQQENVTWIAYKQHFFTSILLTKQGFKNADLNSKNLARISDAKDQDIQKTKAFNSLVSLHTKNGELSNEMNLYFGPSDYKILDSYDRNLDEIIPLGWGIFGFINRNFFIPFFSFLTSTLGLSCGLAIILLTITVRLAMSPVTYKSYVSQARMRVLKPEMKEIADANKDNKMVAQQKTMELYRKAGVNPMSGCLPALLQIPVFYALFNFFPSAFQIRQKSFLWAEDLSSYDTILSWDQYIPIISDIYGNHVSLFPILASIAIFFYMKMTMSGQSMPQQQEGMPDMSFMRYISPIMMLFFFNNYASGLSLYYFISNLITIGIMLVIKNVIIDEEKIKKKINENKLKPMKQSSFSKKLNEIMKQAQQAQQEQQAAKK